MAEGDYLNGDLKWNSDDELLYGDEAKKGAADKKNTTQELNVYSYSVSSKRSTLLIHNGVMPHLSSDGARVLFFGPPDRNTTIEWKRGWRQKPPVGVSLLSSTRQGENRIAFEPAGTRYPAVQWLPDSNQFVSLRETTPTSKATAQLRLWNVDTQSTRVIAELKAKDASKLPRSPLAPQFNIVGATSSKVVISESEFLGFNPQGTKTKIRNTVHSVEITSGNIATELTAIDALSSGYDLHIE